MKRTFKLNVFSIFILTAFASPAFALSPIEELGKALYFDTSLSKDGTQACATCHNPDFGFADPRDNGVNAMASLGDDGKSVGDRNAPTASYAAFSPAFGLNKKGKYVGGQFWDGRAASLKEQAGGPPLNPGEMAMKDENAVRDRLRANPDYVIPFKTLFGPEVFETPENTYQAMTQAIAAFEKTKFFAPFDSKYDRFLKGEVELTVEEELGRVLFFSQQFTNCNVCHQLKTTPGAKGETFSNYEYHNIGTPENVALRQANGVALGTQDQGLLNNPTVDDPAQAGKFKVPTLRNVAVTGPYMHNGIFSDLETVVRFYNKYNSRAEASQINPESTKPWGEPEVGENLSLKELKIGDALDDKRIKALVAFMETLTDQRYEHLLK